MAYSVTKNPDGDVNLGSLNGEFVTLQPSSSDYATSGYALIDGEQVQNNAALASLQNTDMYKIIAALPVGGQGGYTPVWNPVTKKLQVFQGASGLGPDTEVPAGTNLAAQAFQLLLVGL